MTIWQALILGLIQGVTEFLPISSSGHLVLFQQLFGLTEDIFLFDIVLHMATLAAIVAFFGRSLFKVSVKEWMLVVLGTIPAAIIGILFQDQIEAIFIMDVWLGVELIATGVINLYTDRKLAQMTTDDKPKTLGEQLTPKKSVWIGLAQAVAIIPGISRSGSTVAGSILVGLDREAAFRFSFLLAIPALLGAGVLQAKDVIETGLPQMDLLPLGIGFLASLVAGFLSLSLFRYVILKAKLEWFGWYAIILGVAALFIFNPFN